MNVSIVIPACNAAETIAETLASVQAQTFPNWAAIVVDDGSIEQVSREEELSGEAIQRIFRRVSKPLKKSWSPAKRYQTRSAFAFSNAWSKDQKD